MDFFERVKTLVKVKTSLTLVAFIENMGIDYETYKGQRRHNNLPRADEAVKIAQALDVTVEYLVTGKKPEQDTKLQQLKLEIEKLSKFSKSL